jgi:hypothetical protein
MDGVEMLVKRVIMACGVKASDLAAIEAFVPQLKDEIPKLRAAIPGYAIALRDKVESIEAKLAAIDSKLDQLLDMHGDLITSQASPAVELSTLMNSGDVKSGAS